MGAFALATSAAAHTAFIGLLVLAPEHFWEVRPEAGMISTALKYLLPPVPESRSQSTEHVSYLAIGTGTDAPAVTRTDPDGRLHMTGGHSAEEKGRDKPVAPTPLEEAAIAEHALLVEELDSVAVRDPSGAAPEYPESLRKNGVEGYASFRFVVDSTGRVDVGTIVELEATHPDFARAVRDAMPRMKFRPARQGANAVRQISEQRFSFRISKPAA